MPAAPLMAGELSKFVCDSLLKHGESVAFAVHAGGRRRVDVFEHRLDALPCGIVVEERPVNVGLDGGGITLGGGF